MSKSRKPREIRISGARTNNLKNVGCAIPHEALTVVTLMAGLASTIFFPLTAFLVEKVSKAGVRLRCLSEGCGYSVDKEDLDAGEGASAGFTNYPRQLCSDASECLGVVDEAPGLFFCGLVFQYAFSSMVFPGIGRDAEYLARRIADRVKVPGGQHQAAGCLLPCRATTRVRLREPRERLGGHDQGLLGPAPAGGGARPRRSCGRRGRAAI